MDDTLAAVVREAGAFAGLLYSLPPGGDALWLVMMTGAPQETAAPWRRISLDDPMPLAVALREMRPVWVGGPEEMARRFPRLALALPYDFALSAAPVLSGTVPRGGLVLLWHGARPSGLDGAEAAAVEAGRRRLGVLLQRAVDRGAPLRPFDRPRRTAPPAGRPPLPEGTAAASAFADRLPGGSCALDPHGRVVFVTRDAAELVGVDPADLMGALPWELLPWMAVPQVEDRYRAALISREPQTFTVLRPPDTWLAVRLYPDASGVSVRITRAEPSGAGPDPSSVIPAGPTRATVLHQLMHLAATLTEAVGVQDVVEQTADQLLPALGAQGLVLMGAEDGRLRILGHRGYRAELMEEYDAIPVAAPMPGGKVLVTGVPDFFTDFAELSRAYPDAVHEDGMASWAFLPLIASGRPIGSLVLAYRRPQVFPPGERAALTALAGLIGQALDRARLYDAKHDLAHRLQAALLPHTLPRIPGLRCAARYLPAARGLGIGGDFYDLIRIGAETAGAAIGDVQGHNVDAAALMGQVRTAVHAHAMAGASPDDVLARTNRLLMELDPGLFTSCLYVHLDLAGRRARMATAGHPPPLLRQADGRTELLPVPPGLLLGVEPDTRCPALDVRVPPGSVLALYTDGLVEAPGVDIDDATATLAGLLEHGDPKDLDAMADALIRHAPTPGDDIALLLISLDG
ncbi:SpoIIE family protein phosphatase [Streptomyces sp. SID8352]|uniref:SpoIIE family protein phosphatase n=1 Tax=Streptomyces sp. SID8352 TaxID=2690338 RepID=UPI00136B1F15|nr:SpoIIE family protein phosphatase [Streptomyces sp. SID8352]MYU20579.1 SpoIIE family protein phosphatase [Streptomyces sp. SID8352]